MGLKGAIDNLKFDTRMIEINYKSQNLTKEEYKKQLDQLEDMQSLAIPVDLESDDGSDYTDDDSAY